jgi:hypothetical protein
MNGRDDFAVEPRRQSPDEICIPLFGRLLHGPLIDTLAAAQVCAIKL